MLPIKLTHFSGNDRRKVAKIPATSTPKMTRDLVHKALQKIVGREHSGCDLCVKLVSRLKAHILSHDSRKETVKPDPEVKSHEVEKRVKLGSHHCVLCKQSFTQASDLSKHIIHHVRQKEHGKQEKAYRPSAPKLKPSMSTFSQQMQPFQKNGSQMKNNQTRVSFVIRTRKSVIRTRFSSRLTSNDHEQNENGFEAQESVIVEETVVDSVPSSSSSCPIRVSDSCFIGGKVVSCKGESDLNAPSPGAVTNHMPPPSSKPLPDIWYLGRLSKDIEDLQSYQTSITPGPVDYMKRLAGSLLAPDTMTYVVGSSSSDYQIIPESIDDTEHFVAPNRATSSTSCSSMSDLTYATIFLPTPPRTLDLRFPKKVLKPSNR